MQREVLVALQLGNPGFNLPAAQNVICLVLPKRFALGLELIHAMQNQTVVIFPSLLPLEYGVVSAMTNP